MGRYFALTMGLTGAPKTKTKSKVKQDRSPSSGYWLLAIVIALGVFYILQVNSLATQGYEIKKLEQLLTEMRESNKRLELEATALKSMERIGEEVKQLNMVPSRGVDYLPGQGYAFQK